ncbi:MAG: endonuclease MutS2 [Balneolaceae bacterium]|nr:MAG: endonuclease MutS2 [Balneolaceae bacterium]
MILHPEQSSFKIGFQTVRETALRKAFTPYGREYLRKLYPSADFEEVSEQLFRASEWMQLLQSGSNHPLSVADDVRDAVKESRISGNLLPLDDFVVILQNAALARIIKQFFEKTEDEYPSLRKITNKLVNLKPLETAIQRVVTDRGDLRDDASAELKRIRTRINRERNRLRSTIMQVMRRAAKDGMTSDEGATIRNGRMVIPIQAEYKRKVQGFIQDVSSSGQTVYLEPVEALQINNDIRQLEAEEQREIEKIIRQLTVEVRKYADSLLENTVHLALLDAIHCRVKTGLDIDGSIPVISKKNTLDLIRAKNPNLLLKDRTLKEAEPVVPLDLKLSDSELGLIITGPNAGGKSVAMKTAGILSMMLQSGYPIPVQPDSVLPIISGLFLDVGDDQSIENDLSTFSSRLHWMQQTLDQLQPGALILIDEAGSGTDPEEGGALFQAFVEEVINRNCRVIVTTHHGSLKVFAHEHPNVVNGAMEFNQENLSPTYKFKKGIPGSSYAFEIAERMHLPANLMEKARSLLGENRDKMGELLVSLEKKMQESEDLASEFNRRLQDIEKRERIYKEQADNTEQKRKKILEKAYKDAGDIMRDANRRIEEAVEKVVQEGRENKEKIKEARKELEGAKKEISQKKHQFEEETEEEILRSKEKPALGDFVLIGDSNTRGELVEISGKQATILMNGMRVKSKLNKLVKTNPPAKKKAPRFKRSYSTSGDLDLSVKPTLDLRGKRGDEAINELTLYLDKAIARGLRQVEIIHGKGEGILHVLVNEYLDKRIEVESFEIAPWESGGTGCTVANLK